MRSDEAAGIVFSARVRDLSRQSETWGTEIPVVSESAAFLSTPHFLNIPATSVFRVLLRIYDFTDVEGRVFRVKVLPFNGNVPLADIVVITTKVVGQGVAEGEFANLIPPSATDAVRFEVSPTTDGGYWAFVTVTNNATQHVTVITQQP